MFVSWYAITVGNDVEESHEAGAMELIMIPYAKLPSVRNSRDKLCQELIPSELHSAMAALCRQDSVKN